jgi:hypothetical protein
MAASGSASMAPTRVVGAPICMAQAAQFPNFKAAFQACAPANMPGGPLELEPATESFRFKYPGVYELTRPVETVSAIDATVFFMVYDLLHVAVSTGLPTDLPSSPWAGVRALDLVPFLLMNMTYASLVYFIEANFF